MTSSHRPALEMWMLLFKGSGRQIAPRFLMNTAQSVHYLSLSRNTEPSICTTLEMLTSSV